MLNIAESVPYSKPVLSNSGNSIMIQQQTPNRHLSSFINLRNSEEFHPIPEIRKLLPIWKSLVRNWFPLSPSHTHCCDWRFVYGIRKQFQYGILRIESRQNWIGFPEIDGTRSVTSKSVSLNDNRIPGIGWNLFRERNWFRNVQHCEIGWLLEETTTIDSQILRLSTQCHIHLHVHYSFQRYTTALSTTSP